MRLISAILFSCLLLFSGCGKQGVSPSSSLSPTAIPEESSQAALYDYRVAADLNPMTRGSGNDSGFYEVAFNGDGSANLLYLDYATGQQLYLCSSPNCTHDTTACTSYIQKAGLSLFPVVYGDALLLVRGSSQYYGEGQPSSLQIMNLDGSNRRTLHTFEDSVTLNEGAIVGNGEVVLSGTRVERTDQGVVSRPFVTGVDLTTGQAREIYPTQGQEEVQSLFLEGVSETGFILKTLESSTGESGNSLVTSRVFVLPFDGSPEQELLTYTGSQCCERYSAQGLVWLEFQGDQVSLWKEGGEGPLIQDLGQLPCLQPTQLPLTPDNLFIAGFLEDWVLVNHLYQEEVRENGDIALSYTQYAIHLTNGEAREITLYREANATRQPPALVTQTGDTLLVDLGEEVEQGNLRHISGLIQVEDYLNSRDNIQVMEPLS